MDPRQLAYLSRIHMLADLDEAALQSLTGITPMASVRAGDMLVRPDRDPGVLFLLKHGRVRLYKATAEGREITLAVLGDGSVFGATREIALCGGDVYAQAMEDSLVCAMGNQDLERLLARYPVVGIRLLEVLSRRVRELEDLAEQLAHESVRRRILHLLAHLASEFGTADGGYVRIKLALRHADIANMVGSTRETVTLTMSQLARADIVHRDHHALQVRLAGVQAELGETPGILAVQKTTHEAKPMG